MTTQARNATQPVAAQATEETDRFNIIVKRQVGREEEEALNNVFIFISFSLLFAPHSPRSRLQPCASARASAHLHDQSNADVWQRLGHVFDRDSRRGEAQQVDGSDPAQPWRAPTK